MVDLRAFCVIDSLQPQFASFLATVAQGFLPKVGQASLFVEIAPGIEINRVMDIALKSTDVTPGMQIVERHFGMLEVHSDSQADVRQAGQAILDALDLSEDQRLKPRIVSDQIHSSFPTSSATSRFPNAAPVQTCSSRRTSARETPALGSLRSCPPPPVRSGRRGWICRCTLRGISCRSPIRSFRGSSFSSIPGWDPNKPISRSST